MGDPAQRAAILRRRLAFLSTTLAATVGCDKGTTTQAPTSHVDIGDPDPTSGLPTASTSDPAPAPTTKLPPPPSTDIPTTTCDGDRVELERLKAAYESMYAETDAIWASLPTSCAVTDDGCRPKFQPIAKRMAKLDEQRSSLTGLCDCPAPIVSEYIGKHGPEVSQRISLIRDRITGTGAAAEKAGQRWDELVQNEATPRPCLSCVMCEPKSACD